MLASHSDVLRGLSRVPAPLTSAELKDKFLSLFVSGTGTRDEPLRTFAGEGMVMRSCTVFVKR